MEVLRFEIARGGSKRYGKRERALYAGCFSIGSTFISGSPSPSSQGCSTWMWSANSEIERSSSEHRVQRQREAVAAFFHRSFSPCLETATFASRETCPRRAAPLVSNEAALLIPR